MFFCSYIYIYIHILKKGLSTYFFSAKRKKKKVLIFSFELYVLSLFLSLLCNFVWIGLVCTVLSRGWVWSDSQVSFLQIYSMLKWERESRRREALNFRKVQPLTILVFVWWNLLLEIFQTLIVQSELIVLLFMFKSSGL